MRILNIVCYLLFVAGVVAFLTEMWFHVWGPDMFAKLVMSDAGLFVMLFVLSFLLREKKESDKINDSNKLD